MTNLKAQRRIAAEILKRGINGIWIDEDKNFSVSSAITRGDVRSLINSGAIKTRKIKGTSRGRTRALKAKKARGQRRGPGKRKGTANARTNAKTVWINKIRAQRKYLGMLRDEGYISASSYRELYRQSKGNLFRSVRYLSNHIRASGIALKRLPELK